MHLEHSVIVLVKQIRSFDSQMHSRTIGSTVVMITHGPFCHPCRRNFSSTLPGRASWGFIGLGQMGMCRLSAWQ
ncbi:hypothetical protein V1527DRAFT_476461 [Lipomyces starkeyi]